LGETNHYFLKSGKKSSLKKERIIIGKRVAGGKTGRTIDLFGRPEGSKK